VNQGRVLWMAVSFLLLGVILPTACVLWFINESARAETAAARQTVTDAYRAQLLLIRDRIDAFWAERGDALLRKGSTGTPSDFRRIVEETLADSVVVFDDRGAVVYPGDGPRLWNEPELDPPGWQEAQSLETVGGRWNEAAAAYARLIPAATTPGIAARAAQAEVRSLVQGGNREAAVNAVQRYFVKGPAARGVDAQGRLIAADELLLSMQLLKPPDPRLPAITERLTSIVNDYESASMPSAQRVFLMDELAVLTGDSDHARFPTYAAERLAAGLLESQAMRLVETGFQRSQMVDVWTFSPRRGHIVALYRTESIRKVVSHLLDEGSSSAVRFTVSAPGVTVGAESVAAGELLPDWRIAFSVVDTRPADTVVRRRVALLAWVGFLVIAVIASAALMTGRSFQRQLHVTRLKTDLVAAVSHELKTPLASMRLLVDALLEDASFEPNKAREYLQLIATENLRLSRLIDNFLTFSRIEQHRHRFDFVGITPSRIVASAVEAMRERLQAASCSFAVETASDLPVIHADEDALVTALLNLLDNAYKYSPVDKVIMLSVYRDGPHVVFAVRDNGIGISPKEHKRIFRRFYRVDRRLSRNSNGVGLGLSIVEFIAHAHGGTVTVDSQTGLGSTFMLSVPRGNAGEEALA
jgi:signal transduction histidine kinase